jgi:hypothetical protein
MDSGNSQILDVYLREYEKLKEEQISRIGFRDNLLYATLGLFGGILSFSISANDRYYALLVLPWVCLILGWTYIVNDEKITSIRKYVIQDLSPRVAQRIQIDDLNSIFRWEFFNASSHGRRRRKLEQFIVNECTFFLSGLFSLLTFARIASSISSLVIVIWLFELILLIVLGIEIFIYADFSTSDEKKV